MQAFVHLLLAAMAGFFPLGQLALIGGALLPSCLVGSHGFLDLCGVMKLKSCSQQEEASCSHRT